MSTHDNKQLMQAIFAELAQGNGRPFVDSLADDCCWTLTGSTAWSRSYQGKQAIVDELLQPLFAQFATRYTNTAHRFIAEDDHVVVECRGDVRTQDGKPYRNRYCWVCRIANGKLVELTEYMDTELVATTLAPPRRQNAMV
jgi:ketosteroid isomerase-like protein